MSSHAFSSKQAPGSARRTEPLVLPAAGPASLAGNRRFIRKVLPTVLVVGPAWQPY